jgi:1,4-alpha-glucan branching enzyme
MYKKYDDLIKSTLGYDEFTKGYEYYGFNVRRDNTIVYREWAPNAVTASLVGEFSK